MEHGDCKIVPRDLLTTLLFQNILLCYEVIYLKTEGLFVYFFPYKIGIYQRLVLN